MGKKNRKTGESQPATNDAKPIFVSFSTNDLHIAHDVSSALSSGGLSPFLAAEHLPIAGDWQADIYSQLQQSLAVVAILTPRSIASSWVLTETSAAWALGIPIFPLTMCLDGPNLPSFISSVQSHSIETPDLFNRAIADIIERVGGKKRQYSWPKIWRMLDDVDRQLQDEFVPPDMIIGSGKGGTICGAILATNRGIRLKSCDLRKAGPPNKLYVDRSALNKRHLDGKDVLVVEYYRDTGKTFEKIRRRAKACGAKNVYAAAILQRKRTQMQQLDAVAEIVKTFIRPPWHSEPKSRNSGRKG